MTAPLIERLLLLLVLVISIGWFWREVHIRLALFLRAKPDTRFSLRPYGPRLLRFIRRVCLQEKVIRERPLVGLAHAVVFWGFLLFLLIGLDHIATGFGTGFLDRSRGFGLVYVRIVAVFAVGVSVGIVGLLMRRFLVRPRALGEISLESGLIGFFIFLLMVTYLAGLYSTPTSPVGRIIWWLHTLVLAAFLPLIPRSKHFHLLLGPIGVFWQSHTLAHIPTLDYEHEEYGLEQAKDVTRKNVLDAFACVECGRCQENCPAFLTGKLLNPKMIVLDFRKHLLSRAQQEAIVGTSIAEATVFQCTTCAACEYQCPVGIEHLPLIIGLRRAQVNTGKYQEEYASRLFTNLETRRNPFGLEATVREAFLKKANLPLFDGSQEWCLWLGCVGSYESHGQEIIVALAEILRAAGKSFGVLAKEVCTGDSARRLGNDYLFLQLAEQNIEILKQACLGGQARGRKLVSICPHCVKTISQDWPAIRGATAKFEIIHHSRLLAQLAPQLLAPKVRGRLPPSSAAGYTFHDPCYLARYLGETDTVRALLRLASVELREPKRARARTFCCGAGGGWVFLGEEQGKRINRERAEELTDTGAEVIATACPFCPIMLRDALGVAGDAAPQVLDIAEIIAASLGLRPLPPRPGELPAGDAAQLEARLLAFFQQHPGEDFHALHLAKAIDFHGKLPLLVAVLNKLHREGKLRLRPDSSSRRYFYSPPKQA